VIIPTASLRKLVQHAPPPGVHVRAVRLQELALPRGTGPLGSCSCRPVLIYDSGWNSCRLSWLVLSTHSRTPLQVLNVAGSTSSPLITLNGWIVAHCFILTSKPATYPAAILYSQYNMTFVRFASSGPPRLDYEIQVGEHPGAAVTQELPWLQPTCLADVPHFWESYEGTPDKLRAKIVFYIYSVDLAVNSEGIHCSACSNEGDLFVKYVLSTGAAQLTQAAQNLARGLHNTILGRE
jgi:hypothetical protein